MGEARPCRFSEERAAKEHGIVEHFGQDLTELSDRMTGSGTASGGPRPEAGGRRAMRSRGVRGLANGIRSVRKVALVGADCVS